MTAIDAAIAKAPAHADLHACRSDILRGQGRLQEALSAAEECQRLEPNSPVGDCAVGLSATPLGYPDRAAEAFRRALERNPSSAVIHGWLGDTYLTLGQRKLAEESYRNALSLEPNNAVVLNNLGCALERQGKRVEAALAFKSALVVDPTLHVAKENTRSTVRQIVGPAGILGAGGTALALKGLASGKVLAPLLFTSARLLIMPEFWGIAFGVVVFVAGAIVVRRWWNRYRLSRRDPQLVALFAKLEADKRAGRF